MTSIQDRGCLHQERFFIAFLVFSLSIKSEFSEQPAGLLGPKFLAAAINIPKYSKDKLQQIFKTILEARALAPISAPALAPAALEKPQDKPLIARFLDIYCTKSYMNCYNFCQQYNYYFAIVGATEANQISFAAFFLQNWNSFCWQQFKWKQDANSFVATTCDKFKAFFRQSLGDFRAFVDTY